jgi:GTP cyclohydrolase I
VCAHHRLPFFGKAHVGYVPGDRLVGLSKAGATTATSAVHGAFEEERTRQEFLGLLRASSARDA